MSYKQNPDECGHELVGWNGSSRLFCGLPKGHEGLHRNFPNGITEWSDNSDRRINMQVVVP